MSLVAEYTTLEEYLEAQRSLASPALERCGPNFDTLDTPPPLVDAPEGYVSSIAETAFARDCIAPHESKVRPQPSLYDTLLIRALGPHYPADIADRAGIELLVDLPDSLCEDNLPSISYETLPMVALNHCKDDSNSSCPQLFAQQATTAPRRASEKLNNALRPQQNHSAHHRQSCNHNHSPMTESGHPTHEHRDKRQVSISITSLTIDESFETPEVANLGTPTSSPDKSCDVRPSCRPTLPALQIGGSPQLFPKHRHDSISDALALAKFAITPLEGHSPHTLARLHSHASPSSASTQSTEFRQTLPSLETALSAVHDSNGAPYLDPSPGLKGNSPAHYFQHGLSPTVYSHGTPTTTMSPPRLSSDPASWRTNSQNSSSSGLSEHTSATSSIHSSTANHSASTPQSQYPASEYESVTDSELTMMDGAHARRFGSFDDPGSNGYSCSFSGCNALPFQTQYLLNSHTNVHSNQRPHFCPVDGCPRGPGGQGFKRKNEMIRHGLVHQSPGYVCPFCPDQQHKYPRPDNLQRHVRVHHLEKDRDDPLLREVLAQRPEGGNRGRRRRLGG